MAAQTINAAGATFPAPIYQKWFEEYRMVHPDVQINYTRITFSCSTHDQGGVTEKDFKLASQIEEAFKAYAG